MLFLRHAKIKPRELSFAQLETALNEHELWVKSKGTEGKRADLSGVVLNGKNLSGVDLRGADLRCARLSWVDLNEANLSEADLSGAVLNYANLHGCILIRAQMKGCKLFHANLGDAELLEANLEGANLTEAEFSGTALSQISLVEDLGKTLSLIKQMALIVKGHLQHKLTPVADKTSTLLTNSLPSPLMREVHAITPVPSYYANRRPSTNMPNK